MKKNVGWGIGNKDKDFTKKQLQNSYIYTFLPGKNLNEKFNYYKKTKKKVLCFKTND